MYPAGRYNVNFDISAALLALALLVMYFMKKDKSGMRSRIYCIVCIMMILASGNEVVVLAMRNTPSLYQPAAAYIANMISHLAHNLISYMYFVYLVFYIGAEHYISRKQALAVSIPAMMLIFFMLVHPLQHLIYYNGTDGVFYHGSFYWFFYAETTFYFICSLSLLIKWRRALGKYGIFFASLLAVGAVIMIVSIFHPYLKASNFLLALLGLLAFYVVEENTGIVDSETGLLNFAAFTRDSRVLFGTNKESSLITLKILTPEYYQLTYGVENFLRLEEEIGRWFRQLEKTGLDIYAVDKGIITIICYGSCREEAHEAAEKIRERFQQSWNLPGYEIRITAEVWLAHIPEHIKSHEQLLINVSAPADPNTPHDAVNIANAFQVQQRRIAVGRAIARGLDTHGFKVYYQPIYDTRTNSIHSAEALIRLTDPQLGPISPEEFIKIAEQNGNIHEIGMYVFREVCSFYTENHLDEIGIDFIEVNLSTIQCMDAHLADKLKAVLDEYRLEVSHIDLEITESALIHNRMVMNQTVKKLKEMGFTFSLDDFGTGFSNYEYVITFPFSLIKIDKSILWAADNNADNDLVLAHTIQMCKDLNRGIVAEGVETDDQRQKLIDRKVEYLQGFYYSKPVDGETFIHYVKEFNAANGTK